MFFKGRISHEIWMKVYAKIFGCVNGNGMQISKVSKTSYGNRRCVDDRDKGRHKMRLDCRIPGHLICVFKCCSRGPAVTKLT